MSWNFNFHLTKILQNEPDIIGFSTYLWSVELIYKLAEVIKKIRPEIKIILGGSEASSYAETILEEHPCIDVIVRGEGEVSFVRLLQHYIEDSLIVPPTGVQGITYRFQNNIISNKQRNLIEHLDSIPSPFTNEVIKTGSGKVLIESSRGCPFRCTYCDWGSRKLRYFSTERIYHDVDYIFSTFPNPVLYFIDSALNINPKRGNHILKHLIQLARRHELKKRKGAEIQFFTQIETITEEFLELYEELLQYAEVCPITLPIQTLNKNALDRSCAHTNFELVKEKIEIVHRYKKKRGIPAQAYLLIGLDGDTLEGFKYTIQTVSKWIDEGIIDFYWISNIAVSKGTQMFNSRKKNEIISGSSPPYHFIHSKTFPFEDWLVANKIWRGRDLHYSNCKDYKDYFQYSDHTYGGGILKRTLLLLYKICRQSNNFNIVLFFEKLGEFQLTTLSLIERDNEALIPIELANASKNFCREILNSLHLSEWVNIFYDLVDLEVIHYNRDLLAVLYDCDKNSLDATIEIEKIALTLYLNGYSDETHPSLENSAKILVSVKDEGVKIDG